MRTHAWTDDYDIGLKRFDNEHRLLLGLLNDLLDVADLPHGLQQQLITAKLRELHAAVRQHFASEERFMAANDYPSLLLEEHRNRHTGLLQELDGFMARYDQLRSPLSATMVVFLTDWLIGHLIVYDRKLGNYFRGRENLVYD